MRVQNAEELGETNTPADRGGTGEGVPQGIRFAPLDAQHLR